MIALLLILFSILEVSPSFQKVQFGKDKLVWGGILSGFFGGLSCIQGAIRSAFLIKSGLSKEVYIATGVVIACLVAGAYMGKRVLKKVTLRSIQLLIAVILIFISLALGMGLI